MNENCPTCGSILPVNWICSLVICNCRHGGRAWHDSVIGRCTYPNCQCFKLTPVEATIYPKGQSDKYKNISGSDFVKLYKQCEGRLIFA